MVLASIFRGSRGALVGALLVLSSACRGPSGSGGEPEGPLTAQLRLLGAGNWIVVADGAFPLHSSPGITTLYVGGSVAEVAAQVLHAVDEADNVQARIFLDAALGAADAGPALRATRESLESALGGRPTSARSLAELLEGMQATAARFDVVVLKTDEVRPGAWVLLELEAAYGD